MAGVTARMFNRLRVSRVVTEKFLQTIISPVERYIQVSRINIKRSGSVKLNIYTTVWYRLIN